MARLLDLGSRGCRFESCLFYINCLVAVVAERSRLLIWCVKTIVGSNPTEAAFFELNNTYN